MLSAVSIANRYLANRIVSEGHAGNVMRLARRCGSIGREEINAYIKRRLKTCKTVTVDAERHMLATLWKFAFEVGITDDPPRGIARIKVVREPVRAWTLLQCCTAVKATSQKKFRRTKNGADIGVLLRAWMLLGYETGARLSDLWSLREDNFSGGTVSWTQHKTGMPIVKVLSEECVREVQSLIRQSPDGTVLAWACSKKQAQRHMKKLLGQMGMPGSSKWLRRSSATHIECAHPGMGRRHLGHKTPGMAERHYFDYRQIHADIPQAPCLMQG